MAAGLNSTEEALKKARPDKIPASFCAVMAESPPDKITPMLRQYLDLKARYADALLLFQMGDFYETFFEDAEKAAAALNIALTSRSRADAERIPMAGFPIHAAQSYIGQTAGRGLQGGGLRPDRGPGPGQGPGAPGGDPGPHPGHPGGPGRPGRPAATITWPR